MFLFYKLNFQYKTEVSLVECIYLLVRFRIICFTSKSVLNLKWLVLIFQSLKYITNYCQGKYSLIDTR